MSLPKITGNENNYNIYHLFTVDLEAINQENEANIFNETVELNNSYSVLNNDTLVFPENTTLNDFKDPLRNRYVYIDGKFYELTKDNYLKYPIDLRVTYLYTVERGESIE